MSSVVKIVPVPDSAFERPDLSYQGGLVTLGGMGVSQILEEIKALPAEQRWEILVRTREILGPEVPDSFKQGMQEIAAGEVIELDEALEELDRSE